MSLDFERKLLIPMETKKMFPLSVEMKLALEKRNNEIADIFTGCDNRLLLIIGPCSADNSDSVTDYCLRLASLADEVKDKILIIPRVYTGKPRTTSSGYMGLIHQPDPGEKPDVFKGLTATRQLHIRVLRETGMNCADEMLYPEDYRYLDDILAYVAVGARSVENQQHRLLASGLTVPVGMKNPTGGDLSVMLNAITAAQTGHSFIYRGWAVCSTGNPLAHAILRGSVDRYGCHIPNYHYEDLIRLYSQYARGGFDNPSVIIDANHSNSGKDPYEQERIIKEVLYSASCSKDIKHLLKGFMIESYIEDGAQKIGDGVYGKSVTDSCLGWEKSKKLIYNLAWSL